MHTDTTIACPSHLPSCYSDTSPLLLFDFLCSSFVVTDLLTAVFSFALTDRDFFIPKFEVVRSRPAAPKLYKRHSLPTRASRFRPLCLILGDILISAIDNALLPYSTRHGTAPSIFTTDAMFLHDHVCTYLRKSPSHRACMKCTLPFLCVC